MTVLPEQTYHLRVTAVGPSIEVYVDDMTTPKLAVTDATHSTGANGVRVFNTAATFDDHSVAPPTGQAEGFAGCERCVP